MCKLFYITQKTANINLKFNMVNCIIKNSLPKAELAVFWGLSYLSFSLSGPVINISVLQTPVSVCLAALGIRHTNLHSQGWRVGERLRQGWQNLGLRVKETWTRGCSFLYPSLPTCTKLVHFTTSDILGFSEILGRRIFFIFKIS